MVLRMAVIEVGLEGVLWDVSNVLCGDLYVPVGIARTI
jgi:hypothetical protein